ncbi:MAG: hypothetical protein JWO84_99 [Parcubacteria group bacterium]|nr:hypothetical protein [Parcubacteria group bacterium]
MTDSTTSFLKRLKGITLSNNERLSLRERLAAYADLHQITASSGVRSPFGSFFLFIESRRFSSYTMALLLVVVVGGGVTLAADTSVPGDSLYSIKINVNEPVLTALTPTATGQANVAAQIATRRVDEAVILASRGTLTPERQAYLTQKFDTSVKVAAAKADALASTGDSAGSDTVKANFAANLAGEAQALGAVTTNDTAQSADLLRTVVATSERISENGPSDSIAVVANTSVSASESGNARTARPALMAKMASTTATSSAPFVAPARVSKRLRVDISTLRDRMASTTLDISGVLAPKTDLAIPRAEDASGQAGALQGVNK